MLINFGFVLSFFAIFLAMWDIRSEFLFPTLIVVMFCLVVGFLMENLA